VCQVGYLQGLHRDARSTEHKIKGDFTFGISTEINIDLYKVNTQWFRVCPLILSPKTIDCPKGQYENMPDQLYFFVYTGT